MPRAEPRQARPWDLSLNRSVWIRTGQRLRAKPPPLPRPDPVPLAMSVGSRASSPGASSLAHIRVAIPRPSRRGVISSGKASVGVGLGGSASVVGFDATDARLSEHKHEDMVSPPAMPSPFSTDVQPLQATIRPQPAPPLDLSKTSKSAACAVTSGSTTSSIQSDHASSRPLPSEKPPAYERISIPEWTELPIVQEFTKQWNFHEATRAGKGASAYTYKVPPAKESANPNVVAVKMMTITNTGAARNALKEVTIMKHLGGGGNIAGRCNVIRLIAEAVHPSLGLARA